MSDADPLKFSCPVPTGEPDRILLGHGSGGRLSRRLLETVFLAGLGNPILARLEDQATLEVNGLRLAFTTDSFVVKPLFFPGGDIGSLAVHGTVNDLAVGGAQPLALSAAFVIEEGFPRNDLVRVVASMRRAAAAVAVPVVPGDTKVVERGAADGLFVNTSGLGLVREGTDLSAARARPGDAVLVSGTIGDHGIAVLAARDELGFGADVTSDSAPLHGLASALLERCPDARCLRDPTRGGLASTLHEIADSSGVTVELDEEAIPIRPPVEAACELYGLDPLYVANEGKLVAIVPGERAEAALAALRAHPLGRDAARIGRVVPRAEVPVVLRTRLGTTRVVEMLAGEQLPRIC
ncbi:MAG: hydrogenase expression/formation protein HypE [Acidobacteria bacterium]|nr:MAG: hydrogenase expression/formation protein HypE [Acidobacteriota bacterium]